MAIVLGMNSASSACRSIATGRYADLANGRLTEWRRIAEVVAATQGRTEMQMARRSHSLKRADQGGQSLAIAIDFNGSTAVRNFKAQHGILLPRHRPSNNKGAVYSVRNPDANCKRVHVIREPVLEELKMGMAQ
jgi:hypothetical protein